MATSRPPISRVISAASALSHSMVSSFVFEQRRRQAAEFGVVLDDQYGSPFVLRLPHDQVRWSNCTVSVFSNRLRQSGALKNKRDAFS
jgi:hypothetical protein